VFKLAAFTDELARDPDRYADLEDACKTCNEFGLEGAELRNVWSKMAQDFTMEEAREAKKVLDDHGIAVCSIGSWFGKCALEDPKEVADHMDLLRRAADVGLEMGCNLVRGFAFWDHDQVEEKPWGQMLKAYEPVPAILEDKGVFLGLENEAACYVGTAVHLRKFLDMLECPRIKAVWDAANHVQDPQGREIPSFPDGYDMVKNDLIHVHMKDAAPDNEGNMPNVFLGMGACRWRDQFQALMDDGYEGYVSLETHVSAEKFPEELRGKYGKYLTREGRPGASRVCLAWVRDTLAELTGK
jgi:sugar phosphate isomerase/epimerase